MKNHKNPAYPTIPQTYEKFFDKIFCTNFKFIVKFNNIQQDFNKSVERSYFMLTFPHFFPDQVVPPERFGDREIQLKQINYTLKAVTQARPRGGMICGERGIGKTSLLEKTKSLCLKNKILPLHISLHEFDSVHEFYDTVFTGIGAALKRIGLLEKFKVFLSEYNKAWEHIVRIEKKPVSLQTEVESRMGLLLEKMKKKEYKALIFLFDECDSLKKHVVALQILRNVWTSLCQQGHCLGFFFAGSQNLVESLGLHSPLKRHCIPIQLKRFSRKECLMVMESLEEGAKNKLPIEVKKRIIELSGGYPHYIHVLGGYSVEAMEEGEGKIWEKALKNYFLETNEYESVIKKAQTISDNQNKLLIHMDRFGPSSPKDLSKKTGLPPRTIPVHLKRLEQHKIVQKVHRGGYEVLDLNLVEYIQLKTLKEQ